MGGRRIGILSARARTADRQVTGAGRSPPGRCRSCSRTWNERSGPDVQIDVPAGRAAVSSGLIGSTHQPRRRSLMLRRLTRLSTIVAIVAAICAGIGCQSNGSRSRATGSGSDSGGDVRQEISGLLNQYTQALINKDLATLDRIWADDLTFINLRGELLSKQNRMD